MYNLKKYPPEKVQIWHKSSFLDIDSKKFGNFNTHIQCNVSFGWKLIWLFFRLYSWGMGSWWWSWGPREGREKVIQWRLTEVRKRHIWKEQADSISKGDSKLDQWIRWWLWWLEWRHWFLQMYLQLNNICRKNKYFLLENIISKVFYSS